VYNIIYIIYSYKKTLNIFLNFFSIIYQTKVQIDKQMLFDNFFSNFVVLLKYIFATQINFKMYLYNYVLKYSK
jgi:hypothetical protein